MKHLQGMAGNTAAHTHIWKACKQARACTQTKTNTTGDNNNCDAKYSIAATPCMSSLNEKNKAVVSELYDIGSSGCLSASPYDCAPLLVIST